MGVIRDRWWVWLLAITTVATLVRLTYVLVVMEPVSPGLDAIWYSLQGGSIRNGTGYVVPTSLFRRPTIPTAGFPPAYPTYQALWQAVVGTGRTTVRLSGLLPGAATVVATGALARRVAGPGVGLVAAALVALDPSLVAVDGSAMSEVLTVPLVVGILLVGHRVLTVGATAPRLVALGALCGVAALTRQDLVLLVPLVAVPVAVGSRHPGRVGRVGAGALVLVAVALVVVPWAARNRLELGTFTVSTLSPSSALAGANCDATYDGPDLGSWRFRCVEEATPADRGASEVEVVDAQRRAATDHVGDHLSRLPVVLAAREARVWSWWDPRDLARRDSAESRREGWQLVARPVDTVTTVVGAAGLVVLVRRRRPSLDALVLLAPLAVVAASAAVSYGNPRFAAVAQPALAIGAAVVLTTASSRWFGDGRGPDELSRQEPSRPRPPTVGGRAAAGGGATPLTAETARP